MTDTRQPATQDGVDYAAEAVRLVEESHSILRPNDEGPCEADRLLAEAQVYATLATCAPEIARLKAEIALLHERLRLAEAGAYCRCPHQPRA